MSLFVSFAALGLLALGSQTDAKAFSCPPLGPALPVPKSPGSSDVFASTRETAKDWFTNLTADFEGTAVSLTVKSIHEDVPLLDLHHTPSGADERSVSEVNAQTVYRVGSISKVFPPLAALQIAGINMDDPVTKYVPELRDLQNQQDEVNELTTIAWDDITVESLANHLNGFGSDLIGDLTNFGIKDPSVLGLPEVDASEAPGCAGLEGLPSCTKEDFFAMFGKHRPTFSPFTTPMYSNPAYAVLSWVIEAATGESFDSYVQGNIFDVADMARTTSGARPEDGTGFIPEGDIWWDGSLGFINPGGGFYSTTEDLTNLGQAILENRLLSPAQTRKWLKPTEHTSSLGQSVGAPWEVIRTKNLTTDGRVIDLYTKSGSVGPYNGIFVIVPDFEITYALLMGGPEASLEGVMGGAADLAATLIPTLDLASKEDAKLNLVGTYTDEENNSTMTLTIDEGPGLLVTDLVMRGVDVIDNYALYEIAADPVSSLEVTLRLYPSALQADGQIGFQGIFDIGPIDSKLARDEKYSFIPQMSCITFMMFERITYGMNTIGDFVFSVNEDGAAEEIEARFWRVTLGLSDRGEPKPE